MVKLNKIYTRTGDDGTTGLVDGSRCPKHAARMEAIGAVDEANCTIGLAVAGLDAAGLDAAGLDAAGLDAAGLANIEHRNDLVRIQNDLFDLGADLATPGDDFTPSPMVLRMVATQAEWLEQAIDRVNAHLAPLTSFILPGGSEVAARVHMARAGVRRAERKIVALAAEAPVNPAALAYANRLSDYLFVLARAVNRNGADDVLWVPGQNR